MTPVWWMSSLSVAIWLAAVAIAPAQLHPEMPWAMAGPLASAVVTWVAVARTWRAAPERVMGLLLAGFGVKLVFFGGYLAVMLRVLGLRPVPFAAAFTGYVILLYAMEALFLQRLLRTPRLQPDA